MDWTRLPLARATVDRSAHRRTEPDLLPRAWADEATRVLLIADGRLAVTAARDGLELRPPRDLQRVAPRAVGGGGGDALLLFLGEETGPEASTTYLALVLADVPSAGVELAGFAAVEPLEGNLRWSTLREVGGALGDRDAGLATAAVALAAWHQRHPRCALCGAATVPAQGGWTRTCTVDGSDHYPRTDPAVIMAVTDADGRILLGHGAAWPATRFSTLAGYVEPGESLESAVRREVAEEAAIVVGDVTYRGSQPWPFPASLMLAYTATALTTDVVPDGVELTDARWFTREDLAAGLADGSVQLPGRTSVARALIEAWYGGPLADG